MAEEVNPEEVNLVGRPDISDAEKMQRRRELGELPPSPGKKRELIGNVELTPRNMAYLAHEPKDQPRPWFQRRLFLENRDQDFFDARKKMYDSGQFKCWSSTFWPCAREFFGFKGKAKEKTRCHVLESGLILGSEVRAAEIESLNVLKSHLHTKNQKDCTYYDEVKWAFTNWPRFVKRKKDSFELVDEGIMQQEAPTTGAVGLIYYALSNLGQFQGLCAKVLARIEGSPDAATSEDSAVCDDSLDSLKAVIDGLSK